MAFVFTVTRAVPPGAAPITDTNLTSVVGVVAVFVGGETRGFDVGGNAFELAVG